MSTYNKAVINGTTYIDLSGDTVTATKMLSGTTAHDKNGASVTGSISTMTLPTAAITSGQSGTNKATLSRSTSTRYIQIPTGYNPSAAYYTISAVANMTLPTATSSTSSGTSKLSITPGTANKYLNIPTGYNTTTSYYTITGDANLKAENIANGVSIFGITGTHSGGGPTCETKSGGVTWATCCTFPNNGLGWREEKYSDGRLIRWVWDWFTMSSAGRSCGISTSGATAFTTTPCFTVGFRDNGNHACKGSVSAWSNTSVTVYIYENSYGGRSAICVRMEGFWK